MPDEQHQIVKKYLIPTAVKESGLDPAKVTIDDSAIQTLVRYYCRESGVRNLQKRIVGIVPILFDFYYTSIDIEKITRKIALLKVDNGRTPKVINDSNLKTFVGRPVYSSDR